MKYVTEDARTGGPSQIKTEYQYLEGAAWHYDDNDLAEPQYRTWSEWRGYGRVRTIKGDPGQPQSVSEKLYLRGMDGDTMPAGTPPRDVWVTDGDGGRVEDVDQLAGFIRENLLYSGGQVVSASINDPHLIETANDGKDRASIVLAKANATRSRQPDGTWRRTRTTTAFNETGLPLKVESEGDTAVAGDEVCTQTTYARNETKWMLTYAASVRTIAKPCAAWPGTENDMVTDVQAIYDSNSNSGDAPSRGVVTKTLRWIGAAQYQAVAATEVDLYGRTTKSTDVDGGTTTIKYTPDTGNPHTVTTTNRKGWVTRSVLDTARGAALTEFGIHGERADLEYDALGRLLKVWVPGRSKEGRQTATTEYSYEYRRDAPSIVTTKSLKENETYTTSYSLLDGMLRPRQSQTPTRDGGRILTDAFYDSRGNAHVTNSAYYNTEAPSTTLFGAFDNAVPNQTVIEFDDLGRPLESIFRKMNVEQWRTKTRYSGDITFTTPPQGDTATAVIKNALGVIVERRDYKERSADGTYGANAAFDATKYAYDVKGKLSTVTDVQGNKWEYKYDKLGRPSWKSDPDTGATTFEYDDLDQLVSTTDARGRNIVHEYDDLGRKKAMSEEIQGGARTKLAEWVFDTKRAELPTSATRYVNGNAFTQQVDEYDELNRPTFTSTVIPPSEGKLAGTYTYRAQYSAVAGLVLAEDMPAAGGLPTETIRHNYNEFDQPDETFGLDRYASEHQYSPYGETPIEQVTLGDIVLATDPQTGRTEARAVTATWVHDNEFTRTELTIDTDGSAGSATATIEATDWHPFWVADLDAWVVAAEVKAGSWLRTSSGTWVQVTAVRKYTNHTLAHDLTVDGIHSYHVLAAATPLLVHNCGQTGKEVAEDFRENANNGQGVASRRNIAVAQHDIDGQTGQLIGVSGTYSHPGSVSMPATPRQFNTSARPHDSEVKIFETYAATLSPNSKGTINLYSEREVCDSCSKLIDQFKQTFPNVTVNVTWG
ncbi:hypothetical protein ALI144C_06945 [Actinosynnema sp. ALI-1.44]|nr:hypothetical protein ALI144C_06945 [Actinosynnema sp. ALI-1.44]